MSNSEQWVCHGFALPCINWMVPFLNRIKTGYLLDLFIFFCPLIFYHLTTNRTGHIRSHFIHIGYIYSFVATNTYSSPPMWLEMIGKMEEYGHGYIEINIRVFYLIVWLLGIKRIVLCFECCKRISFYLKYLKYLHGISSRKHFLIHLPRGVIGYDL